MWFDKERWLTFLTWLTYTTTSYGVIGTLEVLKCWLIVQLIVCSYREHMLNVHLFTKEVDGWFTTIPFALWLNFSGIIKSNTLHLILLLLWRGQMGMIPIIDEIGLLSTELLIACLTLDWLFAITTEIQIALAAVSLDWECLKREFHHLVGRLSEFDTQISAQNMARFKRWTRQWWTTFPFALWLNFSLIIKSNTLHLILLFLWREQMGLIPIVDEIEWLSTELMIAGLTLDWLFAITIEIQIALAAVSLDWECLKRECHHQVDRLSEFDMQISAQNTARFKRWTRQWWTTFPFALWLNFSGIIKSNTLHLILLFLWRGQRGLIPIIDEMRWKWWVYLWFDHRTTKNCARMRIINVDSIWYQVSFHFSRLPFIPSLAVLT